MPKDDDDVNEFENDGEKSTLQNITCTRNDVRTETGVKMCAGDTELLS